MVAEKRALPCSPEQNSLAERSQRTVTDKARAIIAEIGLDKAVCPDLVRASNYLRNRRPSRGIGKTSVEASVGKTLNPANRFHTAQSRRCISDSTLHSLARLTIDKAE